MEVDVQTLLATGITSLIVSFISVLAAQRLARLDSWRRDARELLYKVNADLYELYMATLDVHPVELNRHELPNEAKVERQEARQFRFKKAASNLRSDCMSLYLIFGNDSSAVIAPIQILLMDARDWVEGKGKLPSQDRLETYLETLVEDVKEPMRVLWEKAKKRGMLSSQ